MSIPGNDILDQLHTEHEEVQSLLDELTDAPNNKRVELLTKIKMELVSHSRAEEKSLYAKLYADAREELDEEKCGQLNEAYQEHALVDKLLKELEAGSPSDEEWIAKVKVLKENVDHHVEEEEDEIFDLARSHFSKEELSLLLGEYMKLKEGFEVSLPTQSQIAKKKTAPDVQTALE